MIYFDGCLLTLQITDCQVSSARLRMRKVDQNGAVHVDVLSVFFELIIYAFYCLYFAGMAALDVL